MRKLNGSAVAVIDMQPWFLDNRYYDDKPYRHKEKLIANCLQVVRWGMKNNLPVVLVEYGDDTGLVGWVKKTHCDISYELKKYPKVSRIIKWQDGGGKELIKTLPDIKNFFLCGVNASYCVAATSSDLIANKRNAFVISEAAIDVLDSRWRPASKIYDRQDFYHKVSNEPVAVPLKKVLTMKAA
jgi:nicotinamidase-related amidase